MFQLYCQEHRAILNIYTRIGAAQVMAMFTGNEAYLQRSCQPEGTC